MPTDYIILFIIAVLCIGGGLYLLFKAKDFRRRQGR
jgi:hypothetical protein